MKKINNLGFTHGTVLFIFVGLFAIAGVGYKVATHAMANNPNNCPTPFVKTSTTPGSLSPLYQYFNNGVSGISFKDHFYTLARNDAGLAGFGWCYEGPQNNQGYAYSTQVPGTVALKEYWSQTIHKHFYTTAASSVEPKGCCGYNYDLITAYVSPSPASGTEPLYRFYNPNTQAHVFSVNPSEFNALKTTYGYTENDGVVAYVWSSPSPTAATKPAPASGGSTSPTKTSGGSHSSSGGSSTATGGGSHSSSGGSSITTSSGSHSSSGGSTSTSSGGSSTTGSSSSSSGSSISSAAVHVACGHGTAVAAGGCGERGGFFVIRCTLSHQSHDDPIAFPGQPGATHLHEFFGARNTNFNSTAQQLSKQPTTCHNNKDTAAYWTPSAEMNGKPIASAYQNEYWFDGGFRKTETIPFGMQLIAGHHDATAPQPTNEVFYYCGTGSPKKDKPYPCPGGHIIMVVVFPQCWDGIRGTGNEISHTAYPTGPGQCPPGFNHVFPRLEEHVHLAFNNPYDSHHNFVFSLSSGPYTTLHGDFINSWSQSELGKFVNNCINAHKICHKIPVAGS